MFFSYFKAYFSRLFKLMVALSNLIRRTTIVSLREHITDDWRCLQGRFAWCRRFGEIGWHHWIIRRETSCRYLSIFHVIKTWPCVLTKCFCIVPTYFTCCDASAHFYRTRAHCYRRGARFFRILDKISDPQSNYADLVTHTHCNSTLRYRSTIYCHNPPAQATEHLRIAKSSATST